MTAENEKGTRVPAFASGHDPVRPADDLNAFLLDPGSRVVNDVLAVIAH